MTKSWVRKCENRFSRISSRRVERFTSNEDQVVPPCLPV